MKTKTTKTVLITKQSTFYQNVGTEQVGFRLSEYHNHAVLLTENFEWHDPWDGGGFWARVNRKYDVYKGNANLNDLETLNLTQELEAQNIQHIVDDAITNELAALA